MIKLTSKPGSQSYSFIRDAGLIHWLHLFPWPPAHIPSIHFNLYLRKAAISVRGVSKSKQRKGATSAFLSSKFHWHVIITIKKNILPVLAGPAFSSSPLNTPFLPLLPACSCDMRYTDQRNGISGSLTAHLPFSFYPVSMPRENSLNRSSLPRWRCWSFPGEALIVSHAP